MFIKKLTFLVFVLINSLTVSQNSTVAKVNNNEIDIKEFQQRIELSPFISNDVDLEGKKNEFLLTLVAEKILAQEALINGYDNNIELNHKLNALEKKLIIDQLFQKKVLDEINLSSEEISEAIKKSSSTLICSFIVSKSKEEINSFYNELKNGISIDSLLVGREEAKEQQVPIKVEFGQMDEMLESNLFSLQPNQFTKPIFVNNIWVIYFIKQKNVSAPNVNDDKFKKKIRNVLKNRKVKEYHDRYYTKLMKDKKVNADIELFHLLADEIKKTLLAKLADKPIEFSYRNVQSLKKNLSNHLNEDFVKFKTNPINLNKFINSMSTAGLIYDPAKNSNIKSFLDNHIKSFIRSEILYRESLAEGLDNSEEVKTTINIWQENFLASLYRKKLINQIKTENKNIDGKTLFQDMQIKIAQLAKKHKMNINFDLLNRINVNPVNVLVYKNYGFGGSGIVFPQISNFSDWYSIYRNLPKDFE